MICVDVTVEGSDPYCTALFGGAGQRERVFVEIVYLRGGDERLLSLSDVWLEHVAEPSPFRLENLTA